MVSTIESIQVNRATAQPPQKAETDKTEKVSAGQGKGMELVDSVPTTEAQIKQAVAKIEKAVVMTNRRLSYSIDEETEQLVVRIIDKETNEVIRQIPPSELLNLAARSEELKGLLFNEEG